MMARFADRIMDAHTTERKIISVLLVLSLALMAWDAGAIRQAYAEAEEAVTTTAQSVQEEAPAVEAAAAPEPEPAAVEEAAPEPAAEEPAAEEPAAEEPAAEEPAAEEPAIEPEPAADDPAAQDEPAADDQPAADEEATPEDPAAEEATDEEAAKEEATDEKAEEEKKAEEITYPAQNFRASANGVTVSVYADKGALPEGTKMKVRSVTDQQTIDTIKDAVEGEVTSVKAVDITFYDKDGKAVEPKKAVKVSLKSEIIKEAATDEAKDIEVVHVADNGATEVLSQNNAGTAVNEVAVQSAEFSIYAVVETGTVDPDARLYVKFWNLNVSATEPIATMSITENQLETELNVNIYDPGVGGMEAGEVFKGWTTNAEYTTSEADIDEAMNIAGVRSMVRSSLISGIEDGEEINLYAMIFEAYHVSYLDELSVTIHTDEVLYRKGATEIPYIINYTYVPYYVTGTDEEDATKAANFEGWKQLLPEETPAPVYDNNTTIDMAGVNQDVTLIADVSYGHWLVFNEGGGGATYTAPLFVQSGKTPEETGMPANPTKSGYSFDGWYIDEACTTAFDASAELTETTNVYAKWTENGTADFTVLVWQESLLDGVDYDFVRAITISGATTGDEMDDILDATVGASSIKVNGEDVYIPFAGTNTKCDGFKYEKYDANNEGKVVANGTSVLNVYFERQTYTLKFYYARSYTYSGTTYWQASSSTSQTEAWQNASTTPVTVNASPIGTEEQDITVRIGNRDRNVTATYYYYYITAEYGAYIGDLWPVYSDYPNWGNYHEISWGVMDDSGSAQTGQKTVKGKITTMDEQVLGDLTDPEGNYVRASYGTGENEWLYNIYVEYVDGESYPATITHNGKRYGLKEQVDVRSRGGASTWQTQQHPPAYKGFVHEDGELLSSAPSGYDFALNYYYERLSYPLLFMDGVYENGSHHTIKNLSSDVLKSFQDEDAIKYAASVSSYNSFNPTSLIADGSQYVFLGWYSDSACTKPYTFTTMAEGGITVYAKWVLKEYKVTLTPNEDGDPTFTYINGKPVGQYTDDGDVFWVDNGEKVGNVGGKRDLYDLVGWFANEKLTKAWDFDAFVLNDTIVGQYGRLYATDGSDSSYNPAYPGTVGEVNLYGSWRRILDGADGINVIYTASGFDTHGNPVEGTDAPEDANKYTDQAEALAKPACKAPEAAEGEDLLAFQYWVVQQWNGTEYVDTEQTVLPGDRYRVNYSDSKILVYKWVNPNDPDDVVEIANPQPGTVAPDETHTAIGEDGATYTIQLRAQYGAAEDATPTHITWFNNYTNSAAGIVQDNPRLAINETVEIPAAPARTGYTFLGWAKKPEVDADGNTVYTYPGLTAANLYLTYHSDTNSYTYVNGQGATKTATGVFADEQVPYDGMYAVWEELPQVTLSAEKVLEGRDWKAGDSFEFTLAASDGAPMPADGGATAVTFTDDDHAAKSFGTIVFEGEGTYFYTISETGYDEKTAGITKSGDASVTVNVARGADGKLVATADKDVYQITNTYEADEVTVETNPAEGQGTPFVTKAVSGTGYADTTFSFTMTAIGGAPMPEGATDSLMRSVTFTADGATDPQALDFGSITYDEPDTYQYLITEGNLGEGWTPDKESATVTVTVADNLEGALTAEVTSVIFTNAYASTPVVVDTDDDAAGTVFATKVVETADEGTAFAAKSFDFSIVPDGDAPAPVDAEGTAVTAASTGNFTAAGSEALDFGKITFTAPGTYTYTVTETTTATAGDGWTMGNEPQTVTVTVADNGQGALVVTGFEGATVTNTYEAADVTIKNDDVATALFKKNVTAGTDAAGGKAFSFTLEGSAGAPMPEGTAAELSYAAGEEGVKAINFGDITFTEPGKYTYTATEEDPGKGWTVTPAAPVEVTVTDNGEGKLVATYTGAEIANAYGTETVDVPTVPAEGNPLFAKDVTAGTDAAAGKTFGFTLAGSEGAPMPAETTAQLSYAAGTDGVKAINFGTLTFSEPGTYTYTVTETAPGDGWTVTGNEATVTITITDNGDGTLSATVPEASATIGNAYAAVPVTVDTDEPAAGQGDPFAKKTVSGEGFDAGKEFAFTIVAMDGAPIDQASATLTFDEAGNQAIDFGTIEYTKAGTYQYTVTETTTAVEGDGWTMDNAAKTVTVVVTDNGDGTLSASVSGAAIENSYKANPVTVNTKPAAGQGTPFATKTVSGTGFNEKTFGFEISGAPVASKAMADLTFDVAGSEAVDFGVITFTEPGTYTYTVKETTQAVEGDGWTMDNAPKTVTVTIADNGQGQLEVESITSATIANAYKAAPVTVDTNEPATGQGDPFLTKTVEGEGFNAKTFEFELKAEGADATIGSATFSAADSKAIDFGTITFTEAGTFTYTVKETTESGSGWTNDTAAKDVIVTVTDNGEGQLKAEVTGATITNSYKAAEVTVDTDAQANPLFTKNVTAASEAAGATFDFSMIETDAEGFALRDAQAVEASVSYGARETGVKAIDFGELTFTEPGTHYYKATEAAPANGWTVENNNAVVAITITDNGEGQLEATFNGAQIANKYGTSTVDVVTNPTDGTPLFSKNVTVASEAAGATFSFEMVETDEQGNALAGATAIQASVDYAAGAMGSKGINFGTLTFSAPGTHYYKLTEATPAAGWTAASTEATATITVTDKGDGTLSATVKGGSISNAYKAAEVTVDTDDDAAGTLFATKMVETTDAGTAFNATSFDFSIAPVGTAPAPVAGGAVVTTASTGDFTAAGSEALDFGTVTFTEAGTYTYTVQETKAGGAGWTNDTTEKIVTVVVTDNGQGQLEVSDFQGATVTNTYEAGNVTINTADATSPFATKTVTGEDFNPKGFEFAIAGLNGAPVDQGKATATLTFDAAGSQVIDFGTVTFTEPGTYQYTVTETTTAVEGDGWTLDGDTHTVTVEVTDNGTGQLTAQVTGTTLTNAYKANPVEVDTDNPATGQGTPFLTKTVTGQGFNAKTFDFELTAAGAEAIPGSATFTAAGSKAIDFGTITYTEPGIYTYTVQETTPSGNGWTNDTAAKDVIVTVTDNGEGQLKAEVAGAAVTNSYQAAPVDVVTVPEEGAGNPLFTKTVTAASEAAGATFSFMMEGAGIESWAATVAYGAAETGSKPIDFGTLTFTEPGTYTYTVTEAAMDGWTATNNPASVTITVTDNGEGQLVATSTTAQIANRYGTEGIDVVTNPAEGQGTPLFEKNVTAASAAAGATFEFQMVETDEQGTALEGAEAITATASFAAGETGAKGIDFGTLHFDAAGTHYYKMTEAEPGAGWTVTGNDAMATITVTDNGDGTLSAAVKGGSVSNAYQPLPSLIDTGNVENAFLTKTVTGTGFAPAMFEFTIVPNGDAPAPAESTATSVFTEAGSQIVDFGEIEFTEAGTYTYTVRETTQGGNGWTNDTSAKTVTVVVADDGRGGLEATVTGATITNSYAAPAPAEYRLIVHYVYEDGTSASADDTRTLVVGDAYDVVFPTIDGYTATINGTAVSRLTGTWLAGMPNPYEATVVYVANAPTPVPPAPTPVPPAPVPPAPVPAAPVPAAPAATITIADDGTPLVEAIDDEGNPLAGLDEEFCWVHNYIILGILLTALYAVLVAIRRKRSSDILQKMDDDLTGGQEEEATETAPATGTAQPAAI